MRSTVGLLGVWFGAKTSEGATTLAASTLTTATATAGRGKGGVLVLLAQTTVGSYVALFSTIMASGGRSVLGLSLALVVAWEGV